MNDGGTFFEDIEEATEIPTHDIPLQQGEENMLSQISALVSLGFGEYGHTVP